MKKFYIAALSVLIAVPIFAQDYEKLENQSFTAYTTPSVASMDQTVSTSDTNPYGEEKIAFLDTLTEIPSTSFRGLEMGFSKKSIPWWAGIIGATLILLNNDEVILENWQREGRAAGWGNEDKTKAVLSMGEIDLLRLPTDFGSFMYFLGDGWMNASIAGGFFLNGYFNNNVRAYNTSLRIVHGMAVSTIFNQILKRSFGRESPYVRTEPFGKWSPFPSLAEYQARTAKYDAMPSGHVMTSTLVFTIINEAYPEYSNYVIPLEILWISALSYQMVNNGVHWASDYPLGIAMGYVFGKASSQMGKKKPATTVRNANAPPETSWTILPFSRATETGGVEGLAWVYKY